MQTQDSAQLLHSIVPPSDTLGLADVSEEYLSILQDLVYPMFQTGLFQKQGYVKVPFISNKEVEELKQLFLFC